MGASASTRKAGGLLTAEQKAEIVQQVGVVPTSEWAADASELTDLEAARAEVLRLRRIIHDAVRDAASRAPSGSPREDEDALDGASSPGARRKKRDGAVRQAVREVGHRADDVYVPVRFEKSAAVEAMLRTMFRTNRLFEKCVSPSAADEAAALIAAFEPRSVRPGETIIRQGSQGEHFYVIEAGAVEISVTTQGNELVVGALEAGASFGELALVYGTPRTATVNAVGACQLWQISRRVYRQIELHFKVGRAYFYYPPSRERAS